MEVVRAKEAVVEEAKIKIIRIKRVKTNNNRKNLINQQNNSNNQYKFKVLHQKINN